MKVLTNKFSNDEAVLIPVCDKCHRSIHGEGGGEMFSKQELYNYKTNPCQPLILLDKLPINKKKTYSFFVGSNFVADSTKTSIFKFSENRHLLAIDASKGLLKLDILASTDDRKAIYLIKDNELLIDTQYIWDMRYSRSYLKIWKTINDKRRIFIEFIIKPDIIIIKRMETTFDGKPFRIYKPREPQRRQIDKIKAEVRRCEKHYYCGVVEINDQYKNHPEILKQSIIDTFKINILQYLRFEYCKQFKWTNPYYLLALDKVLNKSILLQEDKVKPAKDFVKSMPSYDKITKIKEKYKNEFEMVRGTVTEYNNNLWIENITC